MFKCNITTPSRFWTLDGSTSLTVIYLASMTTIYQSSPCAEINPSKSSFASSNSPSARILLKYTPQSLTLDHTLIFENTNSYKVLLVYYYPDNFYKPPPINYILHPIVPLKPLSPQQSHSQDVHDHYKVSFRGKFYRRK